MRKESKTRGFRSIAVFIPFIVVIVASYISIIVSTIYQNQHTTAMSDNTQTTTESIAIIDDFQSQSSILSTTAVYFVHSPIGDDGDVNRDLLNTYYAEIATTKKNPDTVMKRLQGYNWPNSILATMQTAVDSANGMIEHQAKAFALINSMENVEIPVTYLKKISPNYETILTDTEKAYSDEKKLDMASELVLGRTYTIYQSNVGSKSRLAASSITNTSNITQNELSGKVQFSRAFLWSSILLIVVSTNALFIIMMAKLVFPIRDFSRRIEKNERLIINKGLYEVNYLAIAYNSLLDRHMEHNQMLKDVAETDALTGLPNRYSLNEYFKKPIEERRSCCLFVLDINNLKYMNDTFGHDKGDELIKNASTCIKDAFLDKTGKNCFRIGGDEFVVILLDIAQTDIDKHLKIFKAKQKELNVSIAYGYSYTSNIAETNYEKLFIEADKLMYENKEMIKAKEKNLNSDTIYS